MSIATFIITVLAPYYVGEVEIYKDLKEVAIYSGSPRLNPIPADVREMKIREILVGHRDKLIIRVAS